MASKLLCDPVLQHLTPIELCKLKGLNKELREAITKHQHSVKHLKILVDPMCGWRAHHEVYQQYPSVTSLWLEHDIRISVSQYLRPTLEQLTLRIQLDLQYWPRYELFYIVNRDRIIQDIKDIWDFLQTTPEAKLNSFRIEVDPKVHLRLMIPDGCITHYDKDGPIYEDLDWSVDTDEIDPLLYRGLLAESGLDDDRKIANAIRNLREVKNWTQFQIPKGFCGDPLPSQEDADYVMDYVQMLLQR